MVINKIKFLIWLLVTEKLPTAITLYTRNTALSQDCISCPNTAENVNHNFINCPDAKYIWKKFNISLDNQNLITTIYHLYNAKTYTYINDHHMVPTAILSPIILWNVWKNRKS